MKGIPEAGLLEEVPVTKKILTMSKRNADRLER
jgi:hypothetical protein